jgi:diguanylate cyclase (GGDEF)-like protein
VFQVAACILFLLPVAHVLARPGSRSRQTTVVGIAFALFGLAAIPVALRDPGLVAMSSLALLFLCAAYLFLIAAERLTRGVFAAVTGLVTWGLSYPLAPALRHYWPTFTVDHVVIELPQYLIICGIVLTLLEEHVERTERMAMHDPLTDLPNRRLFEERLIATMEEARLDRTTVACLVIDVDNFKTINDTLGHSAGDQLLRALAVRLSWHMGPRDILARTGGDEFTALLAGVHDEHHLRFVAGAMMSAGSVPISIDGKAVDVRISIGIALSPDHADDIDGLRRAADMAMYSAKRRGGSMLAFADEE